MKRMILLNIFFFFHTFFALNWTLIPCCFHWKKMISQKTMILRFSSDEPLEAFFEGFLMKKRMRMKKILRVLFFYFAFIPFIFIFTFIFISTFIFIFIYLCIYIFFLSIFLFLFPFPDLAIFLFAFLVLFIFLFPVSSAQLPSFSSIVLSSLFLFIVLFIFTFIVTFPPASTFLPLIPSAFSSSLPPICIFFHLSSTFACSIFITFLLLPFPAQSISKSL